MVGTDGARRSADDRRRLGHQGRPGDAARERRVPRHARRSERGGVGSEDPFHLGQLLVELGAPRLLGGGEEILQRGLVGTIGVGGVVEDGVQAEELSLRQRVVFVVVALGAADRRAHPGGERGVDPVDHGGGAELLVDRPPLGVGEGVAVEGGGDPVGGGGLGQEVAPQLPDGELVEGHVVVAGADHPVAEAPDLARHVGGVPTAVGIARQVEPLPRRMLAGTGMGEEPVHQPFHGSGRPVGHEGIDFLGRQRQAGQVERQAPRQHRPVGRGPRSEPLRLEPGEDETVDVVGRPSGVAHHRHGRTDGGHVRPVRFVVGTGGDPAPQQVHLAVGEPFPGARRGHDEIGVGGGDPGEQGACRRIAGNDRRMTAEIGLGTGCHVEPQAAVAPSLPRGGIGAVATQAAVRQERLDLAAERRAFGASGDVVACRSPKAHGECRPEHETARRKAVGPPAFAESVVARRDHCHLLGECFQLCLPPAPRSTRNGRFGTTRPGAALTRLPEPSR